MAMAIIAILHTSLEVINVRLYGVRAPIVGHRSIFEPAWLVRLRFIRGSRSILQDGYNQFKDSMFKIRRIGTDVLILSNKNIDELRASSRDVESSVEPFIDDFVGNLTCGLVFLHSDLQNRVLQQRLTPTLASLAPVMKTELDFSILAEIPQCQDWVTTDIVPIVARIVARISARIFLGTDQSRNEEWLTTTAEYTENLFVTGMFLRMFPKLTRPFIAPMFPPYRGLRKNVATARRIIGDIVISRRAASTEQQAKNEKHRDILQWMMDMAVGDERAPENLAQRMLILSLSSIHTTALTMTQALYDLIAHPDYIEPIRSEVTAILRKDGEWQKTTLNRFRKLDSLLKESQRFNPIFLVTFNRILHQSVTLSNGTVLCPGTRIAVPSYHMLHDTRHVPGPAPPSEFDPFRYSRLREDTNHPENAQKFLFAMADSSNMAFGYGKHACPGRFYTSNEMKMILAHILLRYDWKFPDGQERPKNFTIDTDMYPDPAARVMIKQREIADEVVRGLL
ncbi:Ent-kaurene oxidase [Dothidotthia symphoricarpi CBS 119687]|uniref:Ent-kaurene oxidase n=1 Tax=Dothidotthia symphoricarpi CBS 119687 TaxID=1392245 RepID=A0A6A6AD27_9PLEO|nr:Ent-kaurene oxidase [Dothidotthia symphoricarpi CBS 119687]KAF2129173.1 Ent-kaurene oxidase [Dothidotthia symphoricarpi CBS 119687]